MDRGSIKKEMRKNFRIKKCIKLTKIMKKYAIFSLIKEQK
jgi:hypothetical protein